jgi:hypothetical protein
MSCCPRRLQRSSHLHRGYLKVIFYHSPWCRRMISWTTTFCKQPTRTQPSESIDTRKRLGLRHVIFIIIWANPCIFWITPPPPPAPVTLTPLISMDVYLNSWGASTQLAICSKSPCSIAISSWPYLQSAISSSPPRQLFRKVVGPGSEQGQNTVHSQLTHCIM